jgi:ABC-type branched-subunit amino acid transport system ATPase component
MIEVTELTKFYGDKPGVKNVSFRIEKGETVGLLGPNGAGKTTLFNCISGLVAADASESTMLDRSGRKTQLAELSQEAICRLGIARTFQQTRLFDSLSVLDNVLLGCLIPEPLGFGRAVIDRITGGRRHRALRERARQLLEPVGLSAQETILAGALDHGSRRRLEIARALATGPLVLLLDEPAAGMNSVEKQRLAVILKNLCKGGMAVLLIEHDMRLVTGISNIVYVMDHGELIASGEPQEVVRDERVIEAYLGRRQ